MKKFLIFILGLLIGGTAVYFYYSSSVIPNITQTITLQVNAERDAIELEASKSITGTVSQINDGQLLLVGTDNRGNLVRFDEETKVSQFIAQAGTDSQQKEISIEMITAGSRITVIADASIGTNQDIYAKEIIKNE